MKHIRYVLKNGLRVILVPVDEMASATTLLMVGAGSRYEVRINSGISHFLEHMAFKGTKKRPTALEISTLIDGIGAESNAFTGKEITGYFIKSAAHHVNLSLDVLSDMVANLLLDQKEIDKERGVILEELNLYEDTPTRKISDIYEHLLYGDTPMGWDIGGSKAVINEINRKDFVDYMKQLYSADNMVVVVAGKLDEKKTRAQIEKYFSKIPTFKTLGFKKVKENQIKPKVTLKHKKTEQSHFALGVRTVGLIHEKERHPLSILSSILGGGMSSRLFHEIREKRGLAYYVRAYSENYMDLGYVAAFAGADPKRIDEAIKVVVDEYRKVTKKGEITQKELEKAKEFNKGHFVLDLEDTKSVAVHYASMELLEKKIEDPEETIQKIDAVTLDEVHDSAKKYLGKEPLNLAIIGNFKDASRFEKLLK